MSAIIEGKRLSKWFGEVVALNNLDVVIESGVTGLLGPNGAGKSTFIKLALGLYRPSQGYVKVFGASPRNNLAVLQRIGYCPEHDIFYECMTGYEFIYWLNRFWGMTAKPARAAAERACELVKMTGRMHDPIDEYSKGMRQRIKIGQALSTGAELLYLDEPMAGLDPQGREEMFALIRDLGQDGFSVIVSTHILYEIERVTDSVVLLYNGSVLAHGPVREIRDLIDDHPHTIAIGTEEPHALSRHFSEGPALMSMHFEENELVLRTRDPNTCYQQLNDLMLDGALKIKSIRCSDDNLQSVFEYLVK